MRDHRVVVLCAAILSACVAAGNAGAAVTVVRGHVAPDGVAQISGKPAKGRAFKPKAFALSKDARYGSSDAVLGVGGAKLRAGRFSADVALPATVTHGSYTLLACRQPKPSKGGCVSAGAVKVTSEAAPATATPVLDTASTTTQTVAFPGGSASLTTADGTQYTVTVPQNSTPQQLITMTAVTDLQPVAAAGKLIDGVMIGPDTAAPPGTTLTIKRSSVPAGARAVGFGGADPSGGAFQLPVAVQATTTIWLSDFGGYGITVPGSHRGARARAAPCAPAAATPRAAGAQPLFNCIAIASKLQQLSEAVDWSSPASVSAGYIAEFEAVTAEMDRVLAQTPTDEGAAELELLSTLAVGISRQAQLIGAFDDKTQPDESALSRALDYEYRRIKAKCQGPTQSSEVFIESYFDAAYYARQAALTGSTPSDIQDVLSACLKRIKVKLAAHDDATLDNGQYTEHVVAKSENVMLAVKSTDAGDSFTGGRPALAFDTGAAQTDGPQAQFGLVSTDIADGGTLILENEQVFATRKIRCDKNKHLQVDRHAFVLLDPDGFWDDHENVHEVQNGFTIGDFPEAVAARSWAQDFGKLLNSPRIQLELGADPFKKSDAGPCRLALECQTFSFTADIGVSAVPS